MKVWGWWTVLCGCSDRRRVHGTTGAGETSQFTVTQVHSQGCRQVWAGSSLCCTADCTQTRTPLRSVHSLYKQIIVDSHTYHTCLYSPAAWRHCPLASTHYEGRNGRERGRKGKSVSCNLWFEATSHWWITDVSVYVCVSAFTFM